MQSAGKSGIQKKKNQILFTIIRVLFLSETPILFINRNKIKLSSFTV